MGPREVHSHHDTNDKGRDGCPDEGEECQWDKVGQETMGGEEETRRVVALM